MNEMNLSRLFFLHGLVTFLAGLVLIAVPSAIPSAVDIAIQKDSYLICYLLGAAEVAIAFLSFAASRFTDLKSLRLIIYTMIVFHAGTSAVELLAIQQGESSKLWVNVVIRIVVIFLFLYYGRNTPQSRLGKK